MTASPAAVFAEPAIEARFEPDLIRKYDGFGPRYTSYPTADRFSRTFSASDYLKALVARNRRSAPEPLSLYVHLPFCNTICYYCACNKVITANRGRAAKYVRYLGREIGIVSSLLEGERRVEQLHWGGGTPTFLSHDEMASLMRMLRDAFAFVDDTEMSIEVDPRKVGDDTIAFLRALGFNRLSLGIQDFDPAVQKAVNRIQSEAETRAVVEAARAPRISLDQRGPHLRSATPDRRRVLVDARQGDRAGARSRRAVWLCPRTASVQGATADRGTRVAGRRHEARDPANGDRPAHPRRISLYRHGSFREAR